MDFDILDIINDATAEADAFEHHPAADFSMEEQLLYLNGLALVMNADGDIDAREVEYLRILIKSMNLDQTILDDMTTFAQKPDKDTVQAFFLAFRRKPVAQLFLFDALMMSRRDEQVHEREKAVVDKIAEHLEILKGTQQDIYDLFCHIKHKNWQESALYFSSHLLNPEHFKHLLSYHGVDYDALMAETTALRAERLYQVLSDKVKSANENSSQQLLDHNIVIPMFQAELDRGTAVVVKGLFSIKNNNEIKDLKLMELGIYWDQENNCLFSKEEIEIIDTRIVRCFIEINTLNVGKVFSAGLKNFTDIPLAIDNENSEKKITLSSPIDIKTPYFIYNNAMYKYTRDHYSLYKDSDLEMHLSYHSGRDDMKADDFVAIDYSESDSDSKGTVVKLSRNEVNRINLITTKFLMK